MQFEYQIGGSLRADSPSYIYREADHLFYESLRHGKFCYVLNSRQMGKSSLRVQAMRRLTAEGFACIFVDLTGMGRQGLTLEKWYAGFIQALVAGSELGPFSWREWWREQQAWFSPCQCLGIFLEDVLYPKLGKPLIIFVDEIDRVLSQSFSLDDFFGLIRYFSEQQHARSHPPPLTFALLGVASPTDLIQDRAKSPFNIGKAIALSGFSLQEAQPLQTGFSALVDNTEALLQEILDWTSGQPFLTQKVCQLMVKELQADAHISVEAVVRSRILDHWESQDEPEHLRTIRDRILRHRQTTIPCLELYAQILTQGAIAADPSQIQQHLKLSGLVTEKAGSLCAHNRIYQALFDLDWVRNQLAMIRPYSTTFTDWCIAGQADQHLLEGESLDAALQWAADKQLSEKDYQYLIASQQQAKELAQTSLAINETAYDLLNRAQSKAEAMATQYRYPWRRLALVAGGWTCALMGLNHLGWIQGVELSLYDLAMRLNPAVYPDERIVLVTIDENDIQGLEQWPITDQTVADTIQILQSQGVHAVGLDIYRDIPTEPGHRKLSQLFQQSSNIFGIEKMIGQSIPPPPDLSKKTVGFADQVIDDDGKLRRALLSMGFKDQLSFSFATQIALDYLRQDKIELKEIDPDGSRMQLGKAIFHRLEEGQGGYQNVDTGGYQILLNWNRGSFKQISIRQVLNRQVPPGGWRDRIALIGATSEGIKDFFDTPLSYRPFQRPQLMSGVEIHGQIVSLLIGAALGERSLLIPCSRGVAWVWTTSWALAGAVLGGRVICKSRQIIGTGCSVLIVVGSYGLLFWNGYWIIGVTGLLALSGTVLLTLGLRQQPRTRYYKTVIMNQLQSQFVEYPHAGRLAVYLWQESIAKD